MINASGETAYGYSMHLTEDEYENDRRRNHLIRRLRRAAHRRGHVVTTLHLELHGRELSAYYLTSEIGQTSGTSQAEPVTRRTTPPA